MGSAVDGVVVWFSFKGDGEGDVGAFCGGEATEPADRAFDAFGEPLSSASFSGDGDSGDGGACSGSVPTGDDGDHGFAEDEHGGWGEFDLVGDSRGERVDDLARDVLDLGDEAGGVNVATVSEGAHGVGHLQGGCFGVALSDSDLGVQTCVVAHPALVAEVFFGGSDPRGFVTEGEASFCTEPELCGVVHDERAS